MNTNEGATAPIDDGGPAFPQDLQGRRSDDPQLKGMSLRDYFAAKAMQESARFITYDEAADHAYKLADAMIARRKRS